MQALMDRPRTSPASSSGIHLNYSSLRQKWARIGLATQPAERPAAEAAIRKAYEAAGLELPNKIIWCTSPFSQGLVRTIVLDAQFSKEVVAACWNHMLKPDNSGVREDIKETFCNSMRLFDTKSIKQELIDAVKGYVMFNMRDHVLRAMKDEVRVSMNQHVWDSVWHSVWQSTEDCIMQAVGDGLRKATKLQDRSAFDKAVTEALKECAGESVKKKVWDTVMETAWANIRNGAEGKARVSAWKNLWEVLQKPIWENIATPIGECIKACANDSAQASGYGQHDAYWLSFYAYFREVEGLERETEQLTGLLDLAQAAGWFTPHAKVCWISERPNKLLLNDKGKLHANDGPAVAYPDSWGIYATDGALRFSGARQ